MKKQNALLIFIGVTLLCLAGFIWRDECITYQKYINNSRLEGTISTWKSGENFDGNHLILLNPNEVSDYVEFDFSFVKKYTGVDILIPFSLMEMDFMLWLLNLKKIHR